MIHTPYKPFHNTVAPTIREQKQDRLIEGLVEGKAGYQAALDAGYSARQARTPGRLIEGPALRERMQKALRRNGGSLDRIAKVVAEGMSANTQTSYQGKVGQSELPDHKTRVHAARTAAELMGVTERSVVGAASTSVVINIPSGWSARYAEAGVVLEGETE